MFFKMEKKEEMVREIINLRQGDISVKDYSLKFIMLCKYVFSLVSNPRDEMNLSVTGKSSNLLEEYLAAMLYDNIKISCLMVHAQQVHDSRIKRKNRESKRARSDDRRNSKPQGGKRWWITK